MTTNPTARDPASSKGSRLPAQSASPPPAAPPDPGPAGAVDRSAGSSAEDALLRLGAVTAVLGVAVEVAMAFLHPSKADPNDSAAAFAEYAGSSGWPYVHIGQFMGTLLVVLTLVALSRPLSRQPGLPGALASVGAVTAVLVAAVFAVQMAVDGVALKGAIDTWSHASTAADRATAFQVADGIRWVEKALSSFFHLVNGLTLLSLGLSAALGHGRRRWLGWVGALSGAGFLVGAAIVARTGFSAQANRALLPALLLSAVFVLGSAVGMWRGSAPARRRP
jgi:hypothetical protein